MLSPRFRCTSLFLALTLGATLRAADPVPGAALAHELRSFGELGSVLYIAAHPDDENTQLITYLARGRGYRTAYLSITRGDGGQNEIGPELGEKLGLARTYELLAARGLDGGQQFFTRALDYGFSKDYREALSTWDRQQVLGDVVRVIRTFQPDILITRFSPEPSTTHGHHTASAVLAIEAFKLAGDPKAFPEQLATLRPWQPKRILQNGRGFGGRGGPAVPADAVKIEAGGDDPVTGESYASIAARSRAMHKTQAFGNFGVPVGGSHVETFTLLGGEPATKDILDGVDTTWARFPGGAEIESLTSSAITAFQPENPSASIPALLAIRQRLHALTTTPVIIEKERQLDHIVQECLGLSVATTAPFAEVVPGESLPLHHRVVESSHFPVRWKATRYPLLHQETKFDLALTPGTPQERDAKPTLPKGTPPTHPYWLRLESTAGMFRVDDTSLIGHALNPPAFPVEEIFEVGGQELVVADQPVTPVATENAAQAQRPLVVIAPASLHFLSEVQLFAPGATRPVVVEVTAARANVQGSLHLDLPEGWHSSPSQQKFDLPGTGAKTRLSFSVTAPKQPASTEIRAVAKINGENFDEQRVVINYAHLPLLLLQSPARLRVVALDLATRGQHVGYIPGAGDATVEDLEQMGYSVTTLALVDFTPEKLHTFDAIVLGVRASNENPALAKNISLLLSYVENGGTLIAQYNWPNGLRTATLGPYPLSILGDAPKYRVTDEHSPVTFLAPDSPVLTTPNRIGPADFQGWVQERGAYFPSTWDKEHYTAVLGMSDPGEPPLQSSLLVAHYGRGYFVYTGLAFFRQLPAGVPGAFRLFANLVSLGR